MGRFVGIDVSSFKIAVAILNRKKFHLTELTASPRLVWLERLDILYDSFSTFVQTNLRHGDTIFIEEIPYVQNKQSLIRLVHFLAMCRTVLRNNGYDCTYVNISSWKKGLAVKGQKKEDITDRANEIFGVEKIELLSQDQIDALMIAKYAQLSSK